MGRFRRHNRAFRRFRKITLPTSKIDDVALASVATNDAPDVAYGTGYDGTVSFDGVSTVLGFTPSLGVYTLTRDIYCQNMTVGTNVLVKTAGYRVFVKNNLFMHNGAVIGFNDGWSTDGSIKQGGAGQTSVTHSLGGDGASGTYTATAPTAALGGTDYFKQPHQALKGYSITASGGPTFLRGGAGGLTATGGGVVICAARYITSYASVTPAKFAAPGGEPDGGGGVVIVISSSASLPSGVVADVGGGASGGDGTSIYIQLV